MNNCIENMMEEHELIVRVLASLDTLADQLEEGASVPRGDLALFGRFFRDFADRCHHGKEEDRLFAKMNEFGFPREYGPVGVMLAEHAAGREHVRALAALGQGTGPLVDRETRQAVEHIREFVPLLFFHIHKENNILYPMAQQAIPAEELAQLDQACAAFDREVVGPAEVAQLRALAEELTRAYPADPAKLAAAVPAAGCHLSPCGAH
jgi:hemerythrin-like domain-containing protein